MRYFFSIIVVSTFLFTGISPLWGEVVFIVNPSSTIEGADRTLIKEIFLGQIVKWSDSSDVSFVLLGEDEATHKEFVREYLKRNPTQFKNHWKKMLFSGKGKIPKMLPPEKVVEFVATTKGAIGYIGKDADLSTVKILNVAQ